MGIFSRLRGAAFPDTGAVAFDSVPDLPMTEIRDTIGVHDIDDSLQNFAAGIMSPGHDKRFYSQYGLPQLQTYFDLDNLYEGSALGAKIVDAIADDMTREWVKLSWDGYKVGEKDDKAIQHAEFRYNFRNRFNEGLKWGRLYGGAVMVILIKGQDTAQPLVLDSIKQGSLMNLPVFDRWWISAGAQLDEDPNSLNFGLPLEYIVSESGMRVHWTRAIRFNGRMVPRRIWQRNGYWDSSVVQHVIDTLKNYDSTSASLASLVFEANVDVVKVKGLANLLSQAGGRQKLIDRWQLANLIKSINRMLLLEDGDEYQQKQPANLGALGGVLDQFRIDVSAAADIPVTRLFGRAPAGMDATGESDLRNYYDRVKADQNAQLRRPLEYGYQVLFRSTFGRMPENWSMDFNSLWQLPATDKAKVENLQADTDIKYIDAGVVTRGRVMAELRNRGTYTTAEEDDVAMAEELDGQEQEVDRAEAERTINGEPEPGAAPPRQAGAPAAPPKGKGPPPIPAEAKKKSEGRQPQTREGGELEAEDYIRKVKGKWHVYSESGKHLGGPYDTEGEAEARLKQVEYFKLRDT